MKKFCVKAVVLTALSAITMSALSAGVSAAENGFTHLQVTNNPDCYAEITIDGSHFTVDGRVVNDPVFKVKFSTDSAEISNYEFTEGDDHTFHAEFDADYSGEWCNFWLVNESLVTMSYRVQHDESGWYFPDNGLAELNAEKLKDIRTAAPEASAYYISQTADPDEIEQTLSELESIVNEVCGDEEDNYRKAYLIYRWVAENIYYDKDAAAIEVTLDTIAIHNVLDRRRTTCAGYSNTYCAMLETAGIRSVNLKGAAATGEILYEDLLTTGENHEFTAFWYEDENRWVYVDPTWGSNGKYENGEYRYDYPAMDRYFDVTGEAFSLNHRIDKVEERSYTTALDTEEETEETTAEPDETDETTNSEEVVTAASTTSATKPPATSQADDEGGRSGNFVIYIVIGAAGVIIVIIGIILATKNRKDKQK